MLARALMMGEDPEAARANMAALTKALPNSPQVQAQQGTLDVLTGRRRDARAAYTRALALDGSNAEALAGLMTLDTLEGKPTAARTRIDGALAKTPSSVSLLIVSARTYALAGDVARAEEALIKAIDTDTSNLQAYNLLGELYIKLNRLEEARVEFERVAARRPSSVAAHTVIGMLHEAAGRPVEARASFERAVGITRDAGVAANNLAWIYAESGENLTAALELARSAKTRLPEAPEVMDTLGWVMFRMGLFSRAIEEFRGAIDRDAKNATYHYHLGFAYDKNGEPGQARQTLARALTLDPAAPEAAEARGVLAALGGPR